MFNAGFNPYTYTAKQGIFSMLKNRFNWSAILNTTQKTLNIANQAIPLIYQVRPIIDNAKTVFKVMGAMKDTETKKTQNTQNNTAQRTKPNSIKSNIKTPQNINSISKTTQNQPVFFL